MGKRLTQKEFEDKVYNLNNTLEILGTYQKAHSQIEYKCKICGFKSVSSANSLMRGLTGCGQCSGRKLSVGVNDIATTHPYLTNLFQNKKDAHKCTFGSTNSYDIKCPSCGLIQSKRIVDLVNKGICCKRCSSGRSYPERLMYEVLLQLNIEFETEKKFDWLPDKRYDFVCDNVIIETDGAFHYIDNTKNGKKLQEAKCLDKLKDDMAIKNGYKIIRINCYPSEFTFIKDNILNSEMSDIFDLSILNWEEVEHNAFADNMIKTVALLWNNGKCNKQIIEITKLSRNTVSSYLKKSQSFGLTDYTKEESYARGIKNKTHGKSVMCLETGVYYPNASIAEKHFGYNKDAIARVCRGERLSVKGNHFIYVDETEEEYVRRTRKPKEGNVRKVKCLENGVIYPSLTECERQLGLSLHSVNSYLSGTVCPKGYHFEYVNK